MPVSLRAKFPLQEKEKYDLLIARAFGGDKSFVAALNSAFEHFLNLNVRSPEYISLFMDDKLRKGLKVGRVGKRRGGGLQGLGGGVGGSGEVEARGEGWAAALCWWGRAATPFPCTA